MGHDLRKIGNYRLGPEQFSRVQPFFLRVSLPSTNSMLVLVAPARFGRKVQLVFFCYTVVVR